MPLTQYYGEELVKCLDDAGVGNSKKRKKHISNTYTGSEVGKSNWSACPLCFRAFKCPEDAKKHISAHREEKDPNPRKSSLIKVGAKIPELNITLSSGERHLFVKPSRIHGHGVFTGVFIEAGEFIIEYRGDVLTRKSALKRQQIYDEREIDHFIMTFDDKSKYVVDATVNGNCSRYINNSCNPNCDTSLVTVNGATRILIFALRGINAGEELTYDYKFSSDELIQCTCGEENCKQVINHNAIESLGLGLADIQNLINSLK